MTKSEFNRRVAAIGLKSKGIPAARDVLTNNVSMYAAARIHGVSYPVLWRVVKRINEAVLCPSCGEEVKTTAGAKRLRRLNAQEQS